MKLNGWVAGLVLCAGLASGQTAPELHARGILPGWSYDQSAADDINLLNGNLVYQVPLYKFPAGPAGQTMTFGLTYNSTFTIRRRTSISGPPRRAEGGRIRICTWRKKASVR